MPTNNIVGNLMLNNDNYGYKEEIRQIFDSYAAEGVELANDMSAVIYNPESKLNFIDMVLESLTSSKLFTDSSCTSDPFYSNYPARVEQLINNSMKSIAAESAMIGYAPIVAYNPFFLKKQWIDCIFKDVLMTEIPEKPVIEIGFERRYLKDLEGKEYPLPECLYDDDLVRKLLNASTGLNISEEPINIDKVKGLYLIDPTYIPGVVAGDVSVELTHNITICKAVVKGSDGTTTYTVPCNIGLDISTHNFVRGNIKYSVVDEDTGEVTETIEDNLIGQIDFRTNKITVMSTTGATTQICLRGKIANRWNQRSLDTVRRVDKLEKTMPESGPRLNTAVTIEDAADALALQNIDQIADNINIMGATLANLHDGELKLFLVDSGDTQLSAQSIGIPYNDLSNQKMVEVAHFDTMPYEEFNGRITEWMKDAREYFERLIGELKKKLRTQNIMLAAVCNPNLVRFLQDGINWVFTEDTTLSGVKLAYNFGIYTGSSDRVHIVTTQRLHENDGIRIIAIPLTQELITFKSYMYSMVIDRNYRNPMHSLVPNIMATHRTLTFEVFPVQGIFYIDGRELNSPQTIKRNPTQVTPPTTGGTDNTEDGG